MISTPFIWNLPLLFFFFFFIWKLNVVCLIFIGIAVAQYFWVDDGSVRASSEASSPAHWLSIFGLTMVQLELVGVLCGLKEKENWRKKSNTIKWQHFWIEFRTKMDYQSTKCTIIWITSKKETVIQLKVLQSTRITKTNFHMAKTLKQKNVGAFVQRGTWTHVFLISKKNKVR